jgi:hypothetical protein
MRMMLGGMSVQRYLWGRANKVGAVVFGLLILNVGIEEASPSELVVRIARRILHIQPLFCGAA